MNRLEEALRRARRDPILPETFATPEGVALQRFPPAVVVRETEPPPSAVVQFNAESAAAGGGQPAVASRHVTAEAPLVPERITPDGAPALNPSLTGKVVGSGELGSAIVEQYRRLAATLHQAQCNDGIKVVMVASALPGEGKTLTAVNLALTLSESYARRVLLIDADLRRPTMHDMFQVPNASGLTDGLKARNDRPLTVLKLSARLSLLPAGKPDNDPMSALTSERMRRVIEEAATTFDWVVLDTPPVGLLPDTHLLAAMVNVAVLVVRANRTPCALIHRAIESLDRNRVIGVVLNGVDDRAVSPGGAYDVYSAYYGHQPGDRVKT